MSAQASDDDGVWEPVDLLNVIFCTVAWLIMIGVCLLVWNEIFGFAIGGQ